MSGRDPLDLHDERWLARVRGALPAADLDVVEEIAADIAERWRHACASGLGVDAADRQAEADLAAWTRQAAAARRPRPEGTPPWRGWSDRPARRRSDPARAAVVHAQRRRARGDCDCRGHRRVRADLRDPVAAAA